MKKVVLNLAIGLIAFVFTGCSSVQFFSNPELTKKSGLKYYTVKPYLLVDRDAANNSIVKVTIVYLPDLENPQYVSMKNGFGTKSLDLKLADGSISTFGLESDLKIPESIEALAALVGKSGTAIKDISDARDIRGTVTPTAPPTISEIYDIIMTNGLTSVRKIEVK